MKYLTKWGFKENVPQESGTLNTVSKKSERGFSGWEFTGSYLPSFVFVDFYLLDCLAELKFHLPILHGVSDSTQHLSAQGKNM